MKFSSKSMLTFLVLAAAMAPSVVQGVSVEIEPSGELVEYGPGETPAVIDWPGGKKFCEDKGQRLAYRYEWCKDGVISPSAIYGGQKQGDHWAPILDGPNQWVQVGQWYQGAATAYRGCQTHWEIAQKDPLWGGDGDESEIGDIDSDNGGATENEYILCVKAREYSLEDLHGAKFDLKAILAHDWKYGPWGCSADTPCKAELDAELRIWIGLPQAGGGHGPNGMFGGYKVWHTNSAMDTYELLMGKVDSAGTWDPSYQGTGDQKEFQMHSEESIERKDGGYFFTRLTTTDDRTGGITTAPKPKPNPTSYGDPHFITWGGEAYDFHGGCDLVLLENPDFANGLGLNVHIRTNIKTWWSHIKSAAIKIGDHTFEIMAGAGGSSYWINGEDQIELQTGDATIGDFPVHFRVVNDHHTSARIDLGNGDAIGVETFKDFVRVNFKDKSQTAFQGSVGLLGAYQDGSKVGRDGKTMFEDADEFGQEWMVRAADTLLFHDADASQLPLVCPMPDATTKEAARRRLGAAAISEQDAALACARVSEGIHRDACIFDVLATQDKDMVGSY